MSTDPHVDVSVIICALNAEGTLRHQLDALSAQQDAPSFEVLVVDNGSTDNTVAVVADWVASGTGAAAGARVVDASDRRGIPHARNVGVRSAIGRVIAFCDADDVVAARWLASAMAAIAGGASAVTGRIYELTPTGRQTHTILRDTADSVPGCLAGVGPIPYGWTSNLAVKTEIVMRVGGFDESLPPYGCDDIEFGIRLGQHRVQVAYQPEMAIHYRPRSGWRPKARREFRSGVAQACLWARHPDVYGRLPSQTALWGSLIRTTVQAPAAAPGSVKDRALATVLTLCSRAGEIHGMRRWVHGGLLGEPGLLGTVQSHSGL